MSLAAVALRTSSFIAQLILGRILVEDEFGLYALALGFVTIQASLRSVMRPVLIEAMASDPAEADHLHRVVLYGLGLVAIVGMAAAVPLGRAFDQPDLAPLLIPMLAIMPFQLAPIRGSAAISHAMEFANAGRMETLAGVLRHATTVAAALAGLGPFSFLVGSVAASATEYAMVRRYLGLWPSLRPPDLSAVRARAADYFGAGQTRRWIWFSAAALSLGATGDYLGASLTAQTALVGVYFFGYQLTGALYTPMSLAAGTVLVPAFSRIDEQAARRASYLETLRSLAVVGVLFFFAIAVVAAPLTHLMWGGKWDDASFAIIAFAAYAPVRLTHPTTLNVARACGHWNLFVTDIVASGIMTFVTAALGARGGLQSLVISVVAGNMLVTLSAAWRLSRRFDLNPFSALRVMLQPWLIGLAALAVTHLVGPPVDATALSDGAINAALMGSMLVLAVAIPQRKFLIGLVNSIRRGRRS